MTGREAIKDKVQDLLALEVIARDLFAGLLAFPAGARFERELSRLKQDEERHIALVWEISALLEAGA